MREENGLLLKSYIRRSGQQCQRGISAISSVSGMGGQTVCITLFIVCVPSCLGYFASLMECPVVRDEPCNSQYVKFYLHTREVRSGTGEFVEFLDNGSNNLTESHYNKEQRSVLIVHGFANSPKLYSLQLIKDLYLEREEMNVWMLDWSYLTPESCYFSSVYNLGYVGACLASFVTALGRPSSGLHVIGFSLGGHAAALAANHLKPYLIPRVTGLDPAMPLFVGPGHQKRLSPEDGEFVDVIHTNAFVQGNFKLMGHVDYFVNGGINQPGCGPLFKSIECSHLRATLYFAESINSTDGFWGWSCESYLKAITGDCNIREPFYIMGDTARNTTRGLIYVKTADHEPFALGKPRVGLFTVSWEPM